MCKLFYITIATVLLTLSLAGQIKITELMAQPGFSKNDAAAGYYSKNSYQYIINFEIDNQIIRTVYDSTFHLTNSYSIQNTKVALSKNLNDTPVFSFELQIEKNNYEVYSDSRKIIVLSPDFEQKKDSILYEHIAKQIDRDEKRLAIMPFARGLRILTFSHNRNKLYLYEWQEYGKSDTIEFALPESSLSAEELKKYSKSARVRYKNSFEAMVVSPTNTASVIGNAGTNSIFYSEHKIWLLLQTPFYTGYNILELNLQTRLPSSSNIMINDMKKNVEAKNENRKIPYAAIINDYIIIRNSSSHQFEYHIYNLRDKQKIKEYTAGADETLQRLVHSDYTQKGTWLSGKDEKKLENKNAFLRKVASGTGFIALSNNNKDSITITTGSLKTTGGLEGLLTDIGTGMLGYMANLTIGNYQVFPYLQLYGNKFFYCHTKFSTLTLELSSSNDIRTALDLILDNFEKRDLKFPSSFLIKKDEQYLISVFDKDLKKFEVYKLGNE